MEENLLRVLPQLFKEMEQLFTLTSLEQFRCRKKEDLGLYHFGLGTWIRNHCLYPSGSPLYAWFLEQGVKHPDDMSHIVICWFHAHVQRNRNTPRSKRCVLGERTQKSR